MSILTASFSLLPSTCLGSDLKFSSSNSFKTLINLTRGRRRINPRPLRRGFDTTAPPMLHFLSVSAALPPLDLTEDNVRQVLADARTEFAQIFDTSVGMTGEAELVEVDGPIIKISLRGRFWHKRSTVLARLANYLKQRIPEILEVDIEDEKQLDDSPENF